MQNSSCRKLLFGVLTLSVFGSCKNTPDTPLPEVTNYFPVADYIRSQLHTIDSLQLPVTIYRSSPEGADTALLSTKECTELAAPFQQPDLRDPIIAAQFKEESFADQSIPSITFNYTSNSDSMPLKRVDVVLKPDPSISDQVRSIYMEKYYSKGDTLIEEKLFWNDDHYYQILRTSKYGSAPPVLSQLKVVWDPTE